MKMKASTYTAYGGPETLSYIEVDKPICKADEILIKVYASTVNRTDCAMLTGKPLIMHAFLGFFKPRNPILGTDFAGIVESVGSEVTVYKAGDRVMGFNDLGLSSHAEYLTIKHKAPITIIPKGVELKTVIACIEGAHYAHNFLNKITLKDKQSILVYGATGAIGSALVQLIRLHDIHITAVCRAEHIELLKSIGADRVLDYTKQDFTLLPEKFDYIFDAVGKSSFSACKKILKSDGTYISSEVGKNGSNIFYTLFTQVFRKRHKKVAFPIPTNIQRSLNKIAALVKQDKFQGVIDRIYSLEQANEAFQYVLEGKKVGNVVLEIRKEDS